LHFFIKKKEVNYILDSVEFIGKYGWMFLPHYIYDIEHGGWTNIDENKVNHRLGDFIFTA
jgi:hypothetical protein